MHCLFILSSSNDSKNIFDAAVISFSSAHKNHDCSSVRSTRIWCQVIVFDDSGDALVCHSVTDSWHSLEHLSRSLSETEGGSVLVPCNEEPPVNVADRIHEVADSIPLSGDPVQVFLVDSETLTSSQGKADRFQDRELPLLGALKRLSSWHSALVTFLPQTYSSRWAARVGRVLPLTRERDFALPDTAFWRGKISVSSKLEGLGFVCPGFSLASRQPAFFSHLQQLYSSSSKSQGPYPAPGRTLEFLDCVRLETIPPFLLTECVLNLCLDCPDPSSTVLQKSCLSERGQCEETGYLARLPLLRRKGLPTYGDSKYGSTTAWKDSIKTDIGFAIELEETYQQHSDYMHLLVLDSRLLPLERQPSSSLCAVVLVAPQEMHQLAVQLTQDMVLADRETGGKSDSETKKSKTIREAILSLPSLQSSHLPPHRECSPVLDAIDTPEEWEERLALVYRESQTRSLRRLQSSDSVTLSSPLQPEEEKKIGVAELLSYFQADGSAAKENLSPVRTLRQGLQKVGNPEDVQLSCPEVPGIIYHGVHYNRGDLSEKRERLYKQVRDHLLDEETYSSCLSSACTSQPSQSFSNLSTPLSPVRRSPRVHLRKSLPLGTKESLSKKDLLPSLPKTTARTKGSSECEDIKLKPPSLRRSPRKKPTSGINFSGTSRRHHRSKSEGAPTSHAASSGEVDTSVSEEGSLLSISIESLTSESLSEEAKLREKTADKSSGASSRRERHRQKLEYVVQKVLEARGIKASHALFRTCFKKLYQVTKFYVKGLPNSQNLGEEMKRIAEGQVQQVLEVELRIHALKA